MLRRAFRLEINMSMPRYRAGGSSGGSVAARLWRLDDARQNPAFAPDRDRSGAGSLRLLCGARAGLRLLRSRLRVQLLLIRLLRVGVLRPGLLRPVGRCLLRRQVGRWLARLGPRPSRALSVVDPARIARGGLAWDLGAQ